MDDYQTKLNEYIRNMTDVMVTFEVTKTCGYSSFVTIYKDETVEDLYPKIMRHFGLSEIKELYFCAPNGEKIDVPRSNISIRQFIIIHAMCIPAKLVPIYHLPKPVIYRLYLVD